jgi:alkanesulfonate monooxygenase SsuD/methylene tetrahydromethanopterin reductase-like flavin-dependent oxidoreductase (luciferase family)
VVAGDEAAAEEADANGHHPTVATPDLWPARRYGAGVTIAFGVHTGPANTTVGELSALWRRIEELPFEWISIWDHFYSAAAYTESDSPRCFEAVAVHTALAMSTSRVRCGSLVYCAGYRHPAVLANAMATVDQFSGGRCEVGLGAGWHVGEHTAHGIAFGSSRERLDLLEEYAQVVRGLLTGRRFSFEGRFFHLDDAICDPAPVRPMPLWIGGGGEQRTLRIAAAHADGWNVAFVTPEQFAHKNDVLTRRCAEVGRDPASIVRSVNVGVATDDDSLRRQFGAMADVISPGVVMGSPAQMVDGIGRYVEAGAEQVNVALRSPYEHEALERIAEAIDSIC